ncbi:MAG TPA: phospholipase, partial [Mycobacterium sp.]|nr:phospholipase [Mycobacterium sp.]
LPDLPAQNAQIFPALRTLHWIRPPTLLEQVVTTLLVGHDQAYLNQPRVAARSIRVDTSDVGVLDFDLSDQEKAAAYDDGYRAAEEFLSTWDWARYVAEFR